MEVIYPPELQDNDKEFIQGNNLNIHLPNNQLVNDASSRI